MKHYSFDIFDTCFVRGCGAPENLFDLLAYRILGDDSSESQRADFTLIRIKGEKKARFLSGREEISLTSIYQYCDFSGLTLLPNEKIKTMEMTVEREQLHPVYVIKEKIEDLHRRGHKVCYISDMYLPQEFIAELLKTHGFWQDGDSLYLSSTYAKMKRTGTLYKTVEKKEALSRFSWRHYGDNWHSDYVVPLKLGIKATRIKHNFSLYERFLLRQDCFPGFYVNQHMAGISKATRLLFPDSPRYAFAADVIAPTYVPFVYKLLKDASVHAIRRVFFLARDGYILYRIAKHLQRLFPDIELKYLFVSRSSLYLPGLPYVSPENLHALTKTAFEFRQEDQISILGNFVTPEVLDCVKKINCGADQDIFSVPDVLSLLTRYHDEQRAYIKTYFKQEGLADRSVGAAVVDVRGSRSCHHMINAIISDDGYPQVKGYYLEVFANRKMIQDAGPYDSLYYAERYQSNTFSYLSELGNIFEQYFSAAPHARTIAYRSEDGHIYPIFEKKTDKQIQELTQCHESVMRCYSEMFVTNKLHLHLSAVILLSTKLLAYFSRRPLYKYLKALNHFTVNNQKDKYVHIVKTISPGSILRRDISWWRGSVYYTLRTVFFSSFINGLYMPMKKIYHRHMTTHIV